MNFWSIRSICVRDYKRKLWASLSHQIVKVKDKISLPWRTNTPKKLLSSLALLLFLIILFISRLEIRAPYLDRIKVIIEHLFTLIYCKHIFLLVYRTNLCWLCQSSMHCIFFHFSFSHHLFYRELVHFWQQFLLSFLHLCILKPV